MLLQKKENKSDIIYGFIVIYLIYVETTIQTTKTSQHDYPLRHGWGASSRTAAASAREPTQLLLVTSTAVFIDSVSLLMKWVQLHRH